MIRTCLERAWQLLRRGGPINAEARRRCRRVSRSRVEYEASPAVSWLIQAIDWLREVYEGCGGRFTHTPRFKTHYNGIPHSAAGRFVVDFFEMCDPELHAQSISSAMAEVISLCRIVKSAGGSF
jgi:hypothetical protein